MFFDLRLSKNAIISSAAILFLIILPSDEALASSGLFVHAEQVKTGQVTEILYADGIAHAIVREHLLFEGAGRVAFLKSNDDGSPLREGAVVEKGELLAELDRRIDDANVRAARAELDTFRAVLRNATSEYEKAKRLKKANAIQEGRFDAIETAYRQALADVRASEARSDQAIVGISQLQIRAPFDGVISFINVREGDFFSPEMMSSRSSATATPIVIMQPNTFEIITELPVSTSKRVQPGQTAFIVDAGTLAHAQEFGNSYDVSSQLSSLTVTGSISAISPSIDPLSRSVRARVMVNAEESPLIDGGYTTVWIVTNQKDNVVVMPIEALLHRDDENYVFVIEPTTMEVEKRIITIGLMGEEGIEVTDGLSPEDWVVTKGRYRLANGMLVRADLNKMGG